MLRNLTNYFSGFSILCNRSQRNFEYDILGIRSGAEVSAAVATVLSINVFAVLEGDESPHLAVSLHDDAAAFASVSSIGTSLVYVLLSVEVHRAVTAGAGGKVKFDVIYKVSIRHTLSFNVCFPRYALRIMH